MLLKQGGKVNDVKAGQGRFTLSDPSQEPFYVYFSTTDGIDPKQTGNNYRVYYPLTFASRSMGIFYLLGLFLGAVWFLFNKWRDVERRQNFVHALRNIYADISTNAGYWRWLFVLVTASAYLYVFMEWLFLVTMPSFME